MVMNSLKSTCLACGAEFSFRPNKIFCCTRCRQYHHRVNSSIPEMVATEVKPIDSKIRIFFNLSEYQDFVNTLTEDETLTVSEYILFRLLWPGEFDPCRFGEFVRIFLEDFGRELSLPTSALHQNFKRIRKCFEQGQIIFSEEFDGLQVFRDGKLIEKIPFCDVLEPKDD